MSELANLAFNRTHRYVAATWRTLAMARRLSCFVKPQSRHSMRRLIAASLLSVPLSAPCGSPSGEHLAYTVGCVNCHHQTPKEIINAPPLTIVRSYSLPEFRRLMKSGVTRSGRDMLAQSSVMGIVASEQFSHFTEVEVKAIYQFLSERWTVERGLKEEGKIPRLYRGKSNLNQGK